MEKNEKPRVTRQQVAHWRRRAKQRVKRLPKSVTVTYICPLCDGPHPRAECPERETPLALLEPSGE